MKILALEASGPTAGCAIAEDGKIIGEYNVNYGKTHSQTLVPMLDELRRQTELDLRDVDAIALTAGPGSFTGLRIGAATAKGIALGLEKPILAVSTLESLAFNLYGTDALICPIMDARRAQVYTAVYEGRGKRAPRTSGGSALPCLLSPQPMAMEELIRRLNEVGREVIFLGDGVPVYRAMIEKDLLVPHLYAPGHLSLQRAASTAVLAGLLYEERGAAALTDADEFRPEYLRRTQAEQQREKAEKTGRMAALSEGRLVKELRAGDRPKTMASDEATTIYSKGNDEERNIMYRSDVRHEFSDSLAGERS